MAQPKTIEWAYNKLLLLDQTTLPLEQNILGLEHYQQVIEAIQGMKIRGAPALGVAAAYGMAMAAQQIQTADHSGFLATLEEAGEEIVSARPTAVNMSWAVRRMLDVARSELNMGQIRNVLLWEAKQIHEEDEQINRRDGQNGQGADAR